MEAVLVSAVFDRTVLLKGLGVKPAAFHGQRMVHDQLHRHHRVDGGRVTARLGNRIAQARQVHQGGLAQDVMADHAHGEPGKVGIAPALDQLAQVVRQLGRVGAAHQVFGMHPRRVRQAGPGAGRQRIDCRLRIKIIQAGAGQCLSVIGVHGAVQTGGQATRTVSLYL